MLIHKNDQDIKPKRVVIFGASGFVGSAIYRDLKSINVPVLGFNSKDMDLTKDSCVNKIENLIQDQDVILFVSALAPAKNIENIISNLKMVKNLKNALQKKIFSHLIYISSDAVYKDSMEKITEMNCAEPSSEHGLMHLCREKILNNFTDNLTIIRPTLIYGLNDPHNGYGPNQFLRKIKLNENIKIFGKGEELRDHISIESVSLIIKKVILRKSIGIINAVSGEGVSFKEIADLMINITNKNLKIIEQDRNGPMPHNGYRLFNNSILKSSFGNLKIDSWKDGLKSLCLNYNK